MAATFPNSGEIGEGICAETHVLALPESCLRPGVLQVPLSLLAFHRSAFLTRHHLADLECEATNSGPLSGPSAEKAVQ